MPGESDHAAAEVMCHACFMDKAEGHSVKIAGIGQLYAAKVESHHHGIFSGNRLHV